MKLPPLNALRVFEAAARHRSFSRAGDELFISHSAVSHQIKRLEEWFDRPLFRRRSRGIELTEAGETLGFFLSSSFRATADLCGLLRQDRPRAIMVGCIPSIASRWLIPNLPRFSALHPDIEVSVNYARAQQAFTGSGFDVLVTMGSDASAGTRNTRLFSRAARPVCSPHYLTGHGPIESPAAIARAHLLHDEGRSGWAEWFRKAGIETLAPLTGPVFQDFNLLATAVVAGNGIALCPTDVFSAEIGRGDLVVLSSLPILEDEGYFVTTPDGAGENVRLFTEWFIATANGAGTTE